MRRANFIAPALICLSVAGCGGDGTQGKVAAGSPPPGLGDREVVVFKGERLVIWAGGIPMFPPTVPGSSLSGALIKSSAPDVLSVRPDGTIAGLKSGTAELTSRNGSALHVVVRSNAGLNLTPAQPSLAPGGVTTLAAASAEGAIDAADVEWMTDAPEVASVVRGRVTAIGGGEAKILARAGTSVATATITVTKQEKSDAILVIGPSAPVRHGTVFQVFPRSQPAGAVQWTTSSPSIIKPLAGGIFQAMAAGRAEACIRSATAHGCAAVVVR